MRKRDRKALESYIRAIADDMDLRDWEVFLSDETCDGDSDASISPTFGQRVAHIRVSKGFRSLNARRQRRVIVHELLHCHWETPWSMVYVDLEKVLGAQADVLFSAGFRRAFEAALDATATALAKHQPLIYWPETKRG